MVAADKGSPKLPVMLGRNETSHDAKRTVQAASPHTGQHTPATCKSGKSVQTGNTSWRPEIHSKPCRQFEIPECSPGYVVLAVHIAKDQRLWKGPGFRDNIERRFQNGKGVYLAGVLKNVLQDNESWLERKTLLRLIKDVQNLSDTLQLQTPEPYACCRLEKRCSRVLLFLAVLSGGISLFVLFLGQQVWLLPVAFLATGLLAAACIIHLACNWHRSILVQHPDPQDSLDGFARQWMEDHRQLKLYFERCRFNDGMSYFLLSPSQESQPSLLPRQLSVASERSRRSDGWADVTTPTAQHQPATFEIEDRV